MTKKYSGGYIKKADYGKYQIWKTPRGRYSIYTSDGKTIKSNLGSFEEAVKYTPVK